MRRSWFVPRLAVCAIVAVGFSIVPTAGGAGQAGAALPLPTLTPSASPTPSPTPPAPYVRKAVPGTLHVVGNRVVDGNGTTYVLGGVHRAGYWTATGDDMGAVEANSLAQWSSMVRVELNGALVDSACNSNVPAYLARLDALVTQLTSRNIVALLDYHNTGPTGCTTAHQPLPNRAEAARFWPLIAARYASNPLVAYELWNEPHYVTPAQWLNGGTITANDKTTSYVAAGLQELYNAVRSNSTSNLIFVDPNGYSSDYTEATKGRLVVDPARTVWSMHVYTCPSDTDLVCINTQANRSWPAATLTGWAAASAQVPVVVTETGFPKPAHGDVPPVDGTWFRTAADWAGNTSLHGGTALGIVGFADDGSWNGSPWDFLDSTQQWAPNVRGTYLPPYLARVQPPR